LCPPEAVNIDHVRCRTFPPRAMKSGIVNATGAGHVAIISGVVHVIPPSLDFR